jgi:hypothetical protein
MRIGRKATVTLWGQSLSSQEPVKYSSFFLVGMPTLAITFRSPYGHKQMRLNTACNIFSDCEWNVSVPIVGVGPDGLNIRRLWTK